MRPEDESAVESAGRCTVEGQPAAAAYQPVGCLECRMTGLLTERVGIYELMLMTRS